MNAIGHGVEVAVAPAGGVGVLVLVGMRVLVGRGVGVNVGAVEALICRHHPREMLPASSIASSTTYRLQVPLGVVPLKLVRLAP